MRLMHDRKEVALSEQWNPDGLVPKAEKRLDMHRNRQHLFTCYHSTNVKWLVESDNDMSYKVDLDKKSCACGAWEVGGIPCVHVMAVIFPMGHDDNRYVD
ncbi:hypothetical protein C5167_040627 [Papaver somniferum]|uniref:SWIM-type domain-containing protein n=1 Tax=Papaver somniferum TaxID=3469 RepID=A0A4Y7IJ09_PAPSO|nr:hypothetical protein C5167_040627 [Papaver somniferum]